MAAAYPGNNGNKIDNQYAGAIPVLPTHPRQAIGQ
jgi:hypothetical protein